MTQDHPPRRSPAREDATDPIHGEPPAGSAARTGGRRRRLVAVLALVLVLSLPVLVVPFTDWPGLAGMWMTGALPAALAVIAGGRRVGGPVVGVLAITVPVAVTVGEHPVAGALFIGVVSGAAALTARAGLHTSLVLVPAMLSLLMVQPPTLGTATGVPVPGQPAYVIAVTLAVAGGAAWTVLLLPIALRSARLPAPKPIAPVRVWWYATVLAVLCAGSAFVVLQWFPGGNGGWLLMTLLLLVRPVLPEMASRTVQRTLGTVLGAAVAAGLVLAIPSATVLFYLGLASTAGGIATALGPRYWLKVAFLTPAVVFFASPGTDLLARDLDRVVFTVAAAALVTVTGLLVGLLARMAYGSPALRSVS